MMATVLEIDRVTKTFRGASAPAVSAVDLEVEEGELVSILGPSGCGKTTLLRLITGFLRPDSGRIVIGGEDVTGSPPHQRDIGMVYQSYALWPHMTVAQNVAFGLEMRRVARKERSERVLEALELVGLRDYEARYPPQLSGGQQQRVALARALIIRPHVLLLDEPLASLDANLRMQLRFYIRDLQSKLKVTTVFVTHDQEEALAVSDRLVLMRDGLIVDSAPGEALYTSPESEYAMTFIGEANLLDGVVRRVDAEGVAVSTALGELRCSPPRGSVLKGGARVRVGIRPDHIRLESGDETGAFNGGLGELRSRIFLGPWARYEVALGDTTVHARIPSTPGATRLDPGSRVRVLVVEGGARILSTDAEGVREDIS
jgi:putative spermidine/putrescine transport system ATP-binding protein